MAWLFGHVVYHSGLSKNWTVLETQQLHTVIVFYWWKYLFQMNCPPTMESINYLLYTVLRKYKPHNYKYI